MAFSMQTYTADGKSQILPSGRYFKINSTFTFTIDGASQAASQSFTGVVPGMINDGGWLFIINLRNVGLNGPITSVVVNNGSFTITVGLMALWATMSFSVFVGRY